ncbi:DEAD/DEAH box helicase family protein [Trinickia mobilis]|uniref:DEAD/DEAH box helicase family protein n=1 Tax=Trinickia mobilis TaxID=2816356 RepID=UPI001A8E1635|nr:DEAD/DEAH box helicase family protein [Trinickia mobilis]
MNSLRELAFKICYRSGASNVVDDFYVPCMERSVLYRRAVGYFTSAGLSLAARGAAHLIASGGKIQLITSPNLSEEDIEAIERGYEARSRVAQRLFVLEMERVESELIQQRLSALAWLISLGRLEIRIAFRVDPSTGCLARGLYHEKIGVFEDEEGNRVAFTGSQNETAGGFVSNFESIDVYWSWDDSHRRAAGKVNDFEALWAGGDVESGVLVEDFTQIAKEVLEKYKTSEPPTVDPEEVSWRPRSRRIARNKPRLPATLTLRSYQLEAIRNWVSANGRGILEMATGTGKTLTALAAAVSLYEQLGLKVLVVICPYRHLVTQWRDEAIKLGFDPLLAFESAQSWAETLKAELNDISVGEGGFLCVITTNATFASLTFQSLLPYFPTRSLLVADEVHNLGSKVFCDALPSQISLRLGLSATPERWFDPDGTNRLFDYFGQVLEPRLTLRKALELEVLVPYFYFPILIELTDIEQEEYLRLSAEIAKKAGVDGELTEASKYLLLERARLVASAENKLHALRDLAQKLVKNEQMLFYCGDGSVESEVSNGVARQVDEVTRILGHEAGIRVAKYTSDESVAERESLRTQITSGQLQGLVAIRCLDEGVDIPSVRTAVILASSTNPRQFIQRRGRVLRRAPDKENATIYDMIVVPPDSSDPTDAERSLLRKELTRFAEFADLAINSGETRVAILELQKKFDLMDI